MTLLYVTEYALLMPAGAPGGVGQVPHEPPIATQKVDFTAGAATSAAFNNRTRLVRLHTDSICSFVFGLNPTAATTDSRMAAGQTEYHGVPAGASFKVSAITNT